MKVVYIVAEFPSLTETFIAREVEALSAAGIDVRVFAMRQADHVTASGDAARIARKVRVAPRLFSRRSMSIHFGRLRESPKQYMGTLVRTVALGSLRPRRLARNLLFFHRTMVLAHMIARDHIDHVHAQFAYLTAAVGREAARFRNCSFSVGTHAWDIYGQEPETVLSYLAGARFITCCTETGLERLRALLPAEDHDKLLLVRHGLRRDAIGPAEGGKGKLVLAVGRLVRKKGFCNLIDACHILKHRSKSPNCLIVGEGPLREPLTRMVSHLELTDSVKFLGEMPHEAIVDLLASEAAVFVLPSVVCPDGDRDGLPNVILEAMAARLPVITTTASAAGEAIEDGVNGCLVPPDDPDSLAECIEHLLANESDRIRLGEAARQTVASDFDLGRCVAPLVERFRDLLGPLD